MGFNFTSQICTTKEQSERLLTLGLKKETADMCLDSMGNVYTYPFTVIEIMKNDWSLIPLWSLHRLIEILDVWYLDLNFHDFDNAYEQVISYFEERVKGGFIDKNYLKE